MKLELLARAEFSSLAEVKPDFKVTLAKTGAVTAGVMVVLTVLWLVVSMLLAPAMPATADALAKLHFISEQDGWQVARFIFVMPLALLHVPVWLAVASLFWSQRPTTALLTVAFGLLYASFNIWTYWTQVTVVRGLADLARTAPDQAVTSYRLLGFEGGLISIPYGTDVLGYTIWGLAAVMAAFGLRAVQSRLAQAVGILLGLSALMGFVGTTGFVIRNSLLETGVIASAIPFLASLVLIVILLGGVGWGEPENAF